MSARNPEYLQKVMILILFSLTFKFFVAKSSQKITKLKIVIRCQEILNLSHRDISYCGLQQELLLLWVIKFEWGKVKEACLITCYDSLNSSPFWCRCGSRCAVLSFTKGEKYANELLYILEDEFHYVYYKVDESTVF